MKLFLAFAFFAGALAATAQPIKTPATGLQNNQVHVASGALAGSLAASGIRELAAGYKPNLQGF